LRKTNNNKPASPPAARQVRTLIAATATALLTGCSQMSSELGFAALAPGAASAPDASESRTPRRKRPDAARAVMPFAGGRLHLVAPQGYCFDTESSRIEGQGGFALIAHCSRVRGAGWFGARRAAVITASIGPAIPNVAAPQASDIAAMFPGARILETREDQLLPLVRLQAPGPLVTGSSAQHWRGAFILDDHLVALALYAPDGSQALGHQGAALLNELTHRSLESSVQSQPVEAAAPRSHDTAEAPRPQSRPDRPARTTETASADTAREKRGLGQRIAGLFQ
jgi:hypothetical protein